MSNDSKPLRPPSALERGTHEMLRALRFPGRKVQGGDMKTTKTRTLLESLTSGARSDRDAMRRVMLAIGTVCDAAIHCAEMIEPLPPCEAGKTAADFSAAFSELLAAKRGGSDEPDILLEETAEALYEIDTEETPWPETAP